MSQQLLGLLFSIGLWCTLAAVSVFMLSEYLASRSWPECLACGARYNPDNGQMYCRLCYHEIRKEN